MALVADLHARPGDAALRALQTTPVDLICVAGDLLEHLNRGDVNGMIEDLNDQMPDAPAWKKRVYRAMLRMDVLAGKLLPIRRKEPDNENAYAFLRGAAAIAPTYYAPGNHERGLTDADRARIRETGAVLLDNQSATLRAAGREVLVGGLSSRRDLMFLDAFSRARAQVKLLICHHPEYYGRFIQKDCADAVLSGHAHGGQWRAFGRALFAPGQGLFPKYTSGVYDDTLVVSRGLSNTAHVPRLFNPRQLVILEMV